MRARNDSLGGNLPFPPVRVIRVIRGQSPPPRLRLPVPTAPRKSPYSRTFSRRVVLERAWQALLGNPRLKDCQENRAS